MTLASTLHELRGTVVLSGYRCPLYDELFADWRRVDVSTHADGAKDRIESLWLSSRCPQSGLFDTHSARATVRRRPKALAGPGLSEGLCVTERKEKNK